METFYYNTDIRLGQSLKITDTNEVRHAFSSLRIKSGDIVHLINGKGSRFRCEVIESSKKTLTLQPVEIIDNNSEYNEVRLTMAVSILNKSSKMKLLVEKLTELGISEFVPFISERTSFPKMKPDGLQPSMISALKQCGGNKDVILSKVHTFDELLNKTGFKNKYYADMTGQKIEKYDESGNILVVIGPEGGFTENEIKQMYNNEFKSLVLNKRTLRAETAAIISASKFLS